MFPKNGAIGLFGLACLAGLTACGAPEASVSDTTSSESAYTTPMKCIYWESGVRRCGTYCAGDSALHYLGGPGDAGSLHQIRTVRE